MGVLIHNLRGEKMDELEFLKRRNNKKKLETSMTDDLVWRYLNMNYKRKWGAYLKENDMNFASMNIFKRGIKRIM
jgi:hypothetical protein